MTFQEFLPLAGVLAAAVLFFGALGKASFFDAIVVLGAFVLWGWAALWVVAALVVGSWFLPAGGRRLGTVLSPPSFLTGRIPSPSRKPLGRIKPFNKRGR